ncbi:helix-turn-helix domain-containing protein [Desulfitobacterium sp.]|uniref:helix-turn-helix domain-containing protein n=1 Tax=Desulfitobacterium sp. TaxID=49981 RepID=UPI002C3165D4|nr:helix-turn-helix domain-containing protein [Desulfitobacterium sp.]HVJ49093.1 helix-turn-helix domain-containing protein [Desulfitobacterium sp.]
MNENKSLKELIIEAQNGDSEAPEKLINRLSPLLKKYSYKLGYDDACSDLSLWILEAIRRYKPNVIWETNDLDRLIKEHLDKE